MPDLSPVDYDPFAQPKPARSAARLTPVDHDPFAKPSYVPTSAFDTGVNASLGPGRWRETGGYRSPAREDQLRAQGAATVPAGRTSRHSLGTADAPGAHDIVPEGMSMTDAEARLRRTPGVKDVLAEGSAGGQGAHLHVDMANAPNMTPVDHDPFASKTKPPAAQSAASGSVLRSPVTTGKPKPTPKLTPVNHNPFSAAARYAGEEFQSGVVDPLKRVAKDFTPGAPKPTTDPMAFVQGLAKTLKAGGDIGSAIMSLGGGEVIHAIGVRPIATAMTHFLGGTQEKNENIISTALMGIGPEGAEARGAAMRPEPLPADAGADAVASTPRALPKAPTAPKPSLTPVDHDPFAGRRQPALAAAREEAPAELTESHVVGDEANPATRTANALYRLNGANTADKIEMSQFRRDLPDDLKTPETKEALYHALEEPLAGGDGTIPPDLKAAHEAIEPYLKEQTEGINKLRELNDPTVDAYLENSGYVHRIKEGAPNLMEPEGGVPRSPFQTRKSLTTKPDSARQRKYVVLEDEQGNRIFPKGQDEEGKSPYAELRPGMTFRPPGEEEGAAPRSFKVVQPTTKEIEANTKTRYQKDAIDNTLSNVLQIRRALRNKEVLDLTLADMKERGVAHRETWHYRDEDGALKPGGKPGSAPQGFQSLHDNPHTQGWKFDPNDAQVQELKDWLPKREEDWVHGLDRLNNFMLRSDFLSPFVHPKNIAEFWGTSRGFDWLHPEGYGRLAKTLPKAVSEVMTMGPAYKQYLREGSALLSGDARTSKFNEMLTQKAGKELIEDPKSFAALKAAFGDAITTPAKLYQQFQEASHKMMWSLGDIMMMQRVMELQEKGMPIRDAIRKAEEVIPNYRVPAQIMDSPTGGRMLRHLFANNRFIAVGRYHYNRLAAWGRMFKKVAKGGPEERKEAVGQFLAMSVIGGMVLPAIDKGIQMATGNKNARVKRGGITSLPDAVGGVASGREELPSAIAQVIDVAPLPELAMEEKSNKDYFGNDIYSKYASPAANTAREAELPAGQFGPFNMAQEAATSGYGPGRVAGNLFGVDMPQKPRGQVKGRTAKMLRGRERSREKKDPIAMGLENIGRSWNQ